MIQRGIIAALVCMLWVGGQLYSQPKAEQLLQKIVKKYKETPSYEIGVTYTMLRGLTGNHSTETYTGTVQKQGTTNVFSAMGSEIIQTPGLKLVIDHAHKQIRYTHQKETSLQGSPVDISGFLTYFKVAGVEEKNNQWVCELLRTENQMQLPYAKVILYIDKDTHYLNQQELLLANLVPFKEGNGSKMDYGRLLITLDHTKNPDNKIVQLSDYVLQEKDKLQTTEKYQDYTLIQQPN